MVDQKLLLHVLILNSTNQSLVKMASCQFIIFIIFFLNDQNICHTLCIYRNAYNDNLKECTYTEIGVSMTLNEEDMSMIRFSMTSSRFKIKLTKWD